MQGARTSTHSILTDHRSASDHSFSSLTSLNSRRVQAVSSLEDQFISQLATLNPTDDLTNSPDRIALFILLCEAVGLSPRSRAGQAVREHHLLERAMEMTRRTTAWSEERKHEVLARSMELMLRIHVLIGELGPPNLPEEDVGALWQRENPMVSRLSSSSWVLTMPSLAALDAPIFRVVSQGSCLTPIYAASILPLNSPSRLPVLREAINGLEVDYDWIVATKEKLETTPPQKHKDDRQELLRQLAFYERYVMYCLVTHYVKVEETGPPQGEEAKRELLELAQGRIVRGLRRRANGSGEVLKLLESDGGVMEEKKTLVGELFFDAWITRVAMEGLGAEQVLGPLADDEVASLHGCFGITASNDLELIPFVKILEDEMDRRPSKNNSVDILAPAIVEAALADLS